MKKWMTIALIGAAGVFNVACGGGDETDADKSASGGGDAAGSTGGGSMGTAPAPSSCDPSDLGSNDCPEYVKCAADSCQPAYETCLGADYLSGGFAGGTCATYMECVTACQTGDTCDDTCTQACDLDSVCLACMTDTIGGCIRDKCQSQLTECGGGGTSGGTPSGFEATCADLQACCDSLAGTEKSDCQSQYDTAAVGGDIGCAVTIGAYTASGQCQ